MPAASLHGRFHGRTGARRTPLRQVRFASRSIATASQRCEANPSPASGRSTAAFKRRNDRGSNHDRSAFLCKERGQAARSGNASGAEGAGRGLSESFRRCKLTQKQGGCPQPMWPSQIQERGIDCRAKPYRALQSTRPMTMKPMVQSFQPHVITIGLKASRFLRYLGKCRFFLEITNRRIPTANNTIPAMVYPTVLSPVTGSDLSFS